MKENQIILATLAGISLFIVIVAVMIFAGYRNYLKNKTKNDREG